jgi:hypothetical protein
MEFSVREEGCRKRPTVERAAGEDCALYECIFEVTLREVDVISNDIVELAGYEVNNLKIWTRRNGSSKAVTDQVVTEDFRCRCFR